VRGGQPVVLEIEVQGARQVRAAMPEAVQVFIAPPSLRGAAHAADRTRHRRCRGGRAPAARRRAASSRPQPEFGHVVVNDRLDDALELTAIVAERLD
jgi:guanylate kinase